MQLRQVRASDLTVSAVGYGTMILSPNTYGTADDASGLGTLRTVLGSGKPLLDTARLYGDGHNEQLVGKAIAGRRDDVVLATKGGITGLVPDAHVDGSPDALRRDVEQSPPIPGTDHVDLYYLHTPDPEVPFEDSIGEMSRFVAESEVRYLGVSNATLDELRRVNAVHPITAPQDQ